MKTLLKIAAVSALVAAPVLSFAQQNGPVTRAQVQAELAALEKAGYNPHDGYHYPANIQHAEQVLAEQQSNGNTAYGPANAANAQSGK